MRPLQLRVYIAANGWRIIGEHQIPRCCNRRGDRASRRGWFAQKLAVCRVAEIELVVAPSAGGEVGTRGDGLRFQSFDWSVRHAFRRHYGRDGGFTVHGDDCEQDSDRWLDFQMFRDNGA